MQLSISMISAVARAEIVSTRRLGRYWLFSLLALLSCILMFALYTLSHDLTSSQSATLAANSPRYMIGISSYFMTMLFLIGALFIAFDIRARDVRERIADVLDTRPFTNFEFLIGKLIGIVFVVWIPIPLIIIMFQIFGAIAMTIDLPVGQFVEPWSIFGYLFASLTALLLWTALIILLSVVLKNRFLVAVAGSGLALLQFWIATSQPVYLTALTTILPNLELASDILPRALPDNEFVRLSSHWILAFSLVIFAARLYPRRDNQLVNSLHGVILFVIASSLLLYFSYNYLQIVNQSDKWTALHQVKSLEPYGDMQSLTGSIELDRSEGISIDVVVEIYSEEDLSSLILTLNPGIKIAQLGVNSLRPNWTHQDGLLEIEYQLPAQGTALVSIKGEGKPNEYFGYLNTAYNFMKALPNEVEIFFLGYKTSIFDREYVAMTPGGHWLPSTGTDLPHDDPRSHPNDYFQLDLEVVVPKNWLIAGPGKSEKLRDEGNFSYFRFNPLNAISQVALLTSRFEKRGFQAAGINFEILYWPEHEKNFTLFEPSGEKLKERIGEIFTAARDSGYPYPYEALTVVETPNILRGYGGGWRMDTTQSMPGIMMLRENSFPAARFNFDSNSYDDEEGGLAVAQVKILERFFENDFSGGNPFTGLARHFSTFQTSAIGEGAHAINFVLEDLTSMLLTKKRGYFSAHEFQFAGPLRGQVITSMPYLKHLSISQILIDTVTDRPSVWDRALGTSLASLEPKDDPAQVLNVLTLKGHAVTNALLGGLGYEESGRLISELVTRYRGKHFTSEDLSSLASELAIELEPLLGDWLYDTALPGFLVSSSKTIRLKDDQQGKPRYQTTMHVRNDEPAPGLASLAYQWGGRKGSIRWDGTTPYRIPGKSAIEIGIVTSSPIHQIYFQPSLSLNRENMPIQINRPNSRDQINLSPFNGSRPSDWQLPPTSDIVIDDLDQGFSIESDRLNPTEMQYNGPGGSGRLKVDIDQGIPQHHAIFGNPEVWSRAKDDKSWGKYRRTHALVRSGEGDQYATFEAKIPHAGEWRLSYFLAPRFANGIEKKQKLDKMAGSKKGQESWNRETEGAQAIYRQNLVGQFSMSLIADGNNQKIEFDGTFATPGWNDLGDFDLPAGKVSLRISDDNSGSLVVADAIRWRPTGREGSTKRNLTLKQMVDGQGIAKND